MLPTGRAGPHALSHATVVHVPQVPGVRAERPYQKVLPDEPTSPVTLRDCRTLYSSVICGSNQPPVRHIGTQCVPPVRSIVKHAASVRNVRRQYSASVRSVRRQYAAQCALRSVLGAVWEPVKSRCAVLMCNLYASV